MEKDKSLGPIKSGRNYAPWEKYFNKVITPFEEFIHRETTGGVALIFCTVIALFLANSHYSHAYHHFFHTEIGITIGHWEMSYTLHHWINDGLMVLFFFVAGLEIKREILIGELASPQKASLPIAAAVGGMIIPAAIYFLANSEGINAKGWAIPMATDIAFAVGVLVLLGKRVPKALIMFLVALAIVDDLGAVIVIALFYTEKIAFNYLAMAGGLTFLLILLNRVGVRSAIPYFVLGLFLWLAMLHSGVHATIAGILLAMAIPSKTKFETSRFTEHMHHLVDRFDLSQNPKNHFSTVEQRSIVQSLENGIHSVMSPLQRLEHHFHLPVAMVIIPLFALANAGIPISLSEIGETIFHPVTLGVSGGLVLGKFLGIFLACFLMVKIGVSQLPADTHFSHIAGVGFLGGIGFTMSIFISELAFVQSPEILLMAKTGILLASGTAGLLGVLCLLFLTPKDN